MTLRWPLALFSLAVVPLLIAVYLWQMRRKRRGAVRYSNVGLLKAAMPKRPSWRRHLPVGLFLVGLAALSLAVARPQASLRLPFARTSIILAMDVSRSMCATDVVPNRLTVSQEAARKFIQQQPKGTRIGLVAFAGFAELLVPPTTDKAPLLAAIDGLSTARGTVIGAATLKSIDAISSVNPKVAPIASDLATSSDEGSFSRPLAGAQPPEVVRPPKDAKFQPDIVVLLTDGANTRGISPLDAAREAVARGIRVYTIGFGTQHPKEMVCSPKQLGAAGIGITGSSDPAFGQGLGVSGTGGSGFGRSFLVFDGPTLQAVADTTGGKFYRAADAGQLAKVFTGLPKDVTLQKRDVEVSVAFAIAGALLALAAMVLSLLWNRSP